MNSLKESVMIVNLSISQWSARKYDRTATREVEENHNASEAGRFNKVLLKSKALDEISTLAGKIRTYHYDNTLPWGDNGDRILPIEKYFDYLTIVGCMKMEFNQLVDNFIDDYNSEKENSKDRLNTLYNECDYPEVESIRKKFDVGVKFMPVADSNDLRVKMSEEIIDTIKTQITRELENRIEVAVKDMLQRLRDVVQKMADALGDPNKVFRDTLVGNIETLLDNMPTLNFNNDPRVTEAIRLCQNLLVNPDELRNNKQYRKEIAQKAMQIWKEI